MSVKSLTENELILVRRCLTLCDTSKMTASEIAQKIKIIINRKISPMMIDRLLYKLGLPGCTKIPKQRVLTFRISKELHSLISDRADKLGVSINNYLLDVVTEDLKK